MAKRRANIKRKKSRTETTSDLMSELRRFGIVGGLLVVVAVIGSGILLWRNGWFAKKADAAITAALDVTAHTGFSVQDILVEGRGQADKSEIMGALNVERGTPILSFSPKEALTRLQTISWVKTGIVERRLPQTIYVRIYEREPMAVWQLNKQFHLIDREGHALRDIKREEAPALPLVVGEGANESAADIISQLEAQPSVHDHVKAMVRVSSRRWDLHMDNGVIVKLPEERVGVALDELTKAIRDQNILQRKIYGIDLRLPDRMFIQTDEDIDPPKDKKKKI